MKYLPADVQLLASAARTATPTIAGGVDEFTTADGEARGCVVIMDVTAVTATPSVVVTIQGWDPGSEDWVDILASAAITGTGTTLLQVYPGAEEVANASRGIRLPRRWRVADPVHGDTDSITYSLGLWQLP